MKPRKLNISFRKEFPEKKKRKNLTIRGRLIISFLLILLIPVFLVASTSYQTAKSKVDAQLIQAAEDNVELLSTIIDQYLTPKMNDMDLLSSLISLEDVDSINGSNVGTSEAARQVLDSYKQAHPEIELAYIATETGLYMNSPASFTNPEDYDPRTRPWYQQAMTSGGKVIVTSPNTSQATGNLVVTVAKEAADGLGVVAINLNVDSIAQITQSVNVGKEGYVYILDANKNFVYHPTKEIGTQAPDNVQNNNLYKSDSGYYTYLYENKDEKKMVFTTNALTGWKIAGTMYENEVSTEAAPILKTTAAVMIGSLIIGAILVVWILISILKPLHRLREVSAQISEGDLTDRISHNSTDELGQLGRLFNNMADSLHHLIQQVSGNTVQLAAAAEQMASSADESSRSSEHVAEAIQSVAEGADRQVKALQTNRAEMEDMMKLLGMISEHSHDAAQSSTETSLRAEQGNRTVQTAVNQMNSIGIQVERLAKDIQGFQERSAHIVNIVDVIRGIASQTNLLALNASIEAARAGEHGKGFAVVASEIRKLSEQSNQSAHQIAELVTSIEEESKAAALSMESVHREVKDGINLVDDTGTVFEEIQEAIRTVVQQVESVSDNTRQISVSAEKIMDDISNVTQISEEAASSIQEVVASTEEQLATMEEIASSTQLLATMAEELQTTTKKFKI